MNFEGSVAVITGATSGIGAAYAEWFARAGAKLVLSGRRAELLEQARTRLLELGAPDVRLIVGDLADESVATQLETVVVETVPAVLVNNAGFGHYCPLADAPPEPLEAMLTVHTRLPLRLCRIALQGMIPRANGLIVNVGSLAGRVPVPGSALYVATKAFLERFSETLALEAAAYGVVVQAMTPGYVRTDFHRMVDDYRTRRRNKGLIRWMSPQAVVTVSMRAADRAFGRLSARTAGAKARYRVPRRRDVVVIPGVANRLLAAIAPCVPRRVIYRATTGRSPL